MMSATYQTELREACRLAREAWEKIRHYYGGVYAVTDKADGPATTADHEANAFIVGALRDLFPRDKILSEEGVAVEGAPAAGERLWIVDPIDGTNDFINGTGHFAIQIGLATDAGDCYRPRLGVVYHPVAREIFWAVEGCGAYGQVGGDEARRLHVSTSPDPQHGIAVMTRNHRTDRFLRLMERLAPQESITMGSMGLKIVWVAAGRADFYLNNARNMCKEWDICAPEIILREAGGLMTHLETGDEVCYNQAEPTVPRGILATNGQAHHELRKRILEEEKSVRLQARQRGEIV